MNSENWVEKVREDFPILKRKIRDKQIIYFDNAATTQKPKQVIEKLTHFYFNHNANIRRGVNSFTEEATTMFEEAEQKLKNFFNANNYEVVVTKGTTEGINLVAYSLIKSYLKEGDEIIISEAEHHSNIVPFHLINKIKKINLRYLPITEDGYLAIEMLKKLINHKTKLISLTHISNVLGIIYPIEEVIKTAKEFSIPVMIDGAQSAPHIKINLENLSPTFFVFSAHKMLGPNGVGFVFIEKEFSKTMEPFLGGGGMITSVKKYSSEYQPVPLLFEGGTIDYPGVIAFSAALEYLDKVGMENIRQHEQILTKKITETLTSHPVIQLFGTTSIKDKIGLVSFNIKNVHPHDVNTVLDNEGILVRSGHHCAQVLMEKFNVMGTVRVSLYLYNTLEEVEKFAQAVEKAINIFKSIGTL